MKTLVIPDVHLKHERASSIISAENPKQVVFLGDLFDAKGEPRNLPQNAYQTALWAKSLMENPNGVTYKFTEGNHDAHYRRTADWVSCSGYSDQCQRAIDMVLDGYHWREFKRYHIVEGFLLSHAGVSMQHVPEAIRNTKSLEQLENWLVDQVKESDEMLKKNLPHWIYGCGLSRGGYSPVGGMNWCDFGDEFVPIEGIKQIVGHSCGPSVRFTSNGDCCLDTKLNHYGIIEGGKFEVKAINENGKK